MEDIENQVIEMILDDYKDETIEKAIRYTIKRTLKKGKKNA